MSTLTDVALTDLLNHPPFRTLPAGKQLTLAFGGIYVASTTVSAKSLLVWETEKGYPRYYIPTDSLHDEVRMHMGKPLERGGITISGKACSINTSALIKSVDNESEGVIDIFRLGERQMSWARFLKGPLEGYIRFERSELGKLNLSSYWRSKALANAVLIKTIGSKMAHSSSQSRTLINASTQHQLPATSS
jgi:hypothetical protein